MMIRFPSRSRLLLVGMSSVILFSQVTEACMSSFGWAKHHPRRVAISSLLSAAAAAAASSDDTGSIRAEWKCHKQAGGCSHIDPPRSGHVAFHDPQTGVLHAFGGYAEVGEDRFVVNDLWKFAPPESSEPSAPWGWTQVKQKEETIPGPRLVSAVAHVGENKKAVLLGGWDPQTEGTGGIILDDVHLLDTDHAEYKWIALAGAPMPDGPTSRHVALSLQGNKAMVHTHRCTDHVLVLQQEGSNPDDYKWTKQATTGPAPSPRGLHVACQSGIYAVLFGGAAQDGNMSNEVYILNTSTWHWTKPSPTISSDISGASPSPRASPCMVKLESDGKDEDMHRFIVFGGAERSETQGLMGKSDVWLLSVSISKETIEWTPLLSSDDEIGSCPPGRNAATLSHVPTWPNMSTKDETVFLLQGGWAPFRKTWDDVWTLHISTK
eukprot:scaffold1050_cov51-Attheya_sp.AAC.8